MNIISYTIELKSDAQTGSGFGGESVNNYVTRDGSGNPVVHASHIKGLLRQTLRDIFGDLQWDRGMIDQAMGLPGSPPPVPGEQDKSASAGVESGFTFTDARVDQSTKSERPITRVITRTSLDANTGTVKKSSLRMQEAVSAGRKFHGQIMPRSGVNPEADLLLRLALLSLRAIGSGRNRGSGCCVATIQGEGRTPGQLLLEIANLPPTAPPGAVLTPMPAATTQTAWFDVCFFADKSVLCPERPEVLNEIHSGISIPASAVQGLILHTLNAMNPEIAAQCFADPRFRAWPLNPCGPADMDKRNLPWPVRVSITHKTAKIISDPPRDGIDFADEAIESYDWEKLPANAPILKSSDGVLLAGSDGKISLWKANDMPRVFSVHGVHSDPNTRGGRNIFSVQAMGALAWRGLVACPAELAAILRDRLHEKAVSFGKARSVRGAGTLHLRPIGDGGLMPLIHAGKYNCFITQSPIDMADATRGQADEAFLEALANAWAEKHGIGPVQSVWQNVGLRFGWNRHGRSEATARGRVPAARVILPGAVISLKSIVTDPDRLRNALLDGLGTGRDRGFGCLLPHPGRAASLCRVGHRIPKSPASPNREAIIRALDFSTETNLSASQIELLYKSLLAGPDLAKAFLKAQGQRGALGYAAWSSSIGKLGEWVNGDQTAARLSIEMLRDLRASEQGGE